MALPFGVPLSLVITLCLEAPLTPPEALVKKAIAFYKANGRAQMIQEVNGPGGCLHEGGLYVFVYDMFGTVVAHGQKPELIGRNFYNIPDPAGNYFARERIRIVHQKGKGWQDYVYLNPENKKWEYKTAYVEGVEDLIFGCGTYKAKKTK